MKTDRDIGLDILKGVCIVLVVLGHLPHLGSWEHWFSALSANLYTFHVPAFVLVSGFLFGNKAGEHRDFMGVANRLLRPYFVVSLLLGFGMLFASRCGLSFNVSDSDTFLKLLSGVLLGHGSGASWFLYTLAICQLLMLLALALTRFLNNKMLSVLLSVTAVQLVGCIMDHDWCPIILQTWFASFFALGVLLRQLFSHFPASPIWVCVFVFVGFFVRHNWGSVGNVIWVVSFCGFVVWTGRKIAATGFGKVAAYLGNRSIAVLLFHVVFVSVLRRFGGIVLKFEPTGVLALALITAISICGCLAVDWLLQRTKYTRWMI